MGFAVLGVLIERASGRPLEAVLQDRIFEPLGMKHTGFSVPADKLDRLATCYQSSAEGGALEHYDGVEDSQWCRSPAFPDATGGLVSTVDDYLAFGQMLLHEGRHGSERILLGHSVKAMTTNYLTAEQRVASDSVPIFLEERGWGLGVSIHPKMNGTASCERYGWDGGLGTSWLSDKANGMVAILMTQRLPPSMELFSDFGTLVHDEMDS